MTTSTHTDAIKRQAPQTLHQPFLEGDLFDSPSSWINSPQLAYASWIGGNKYLQDSTKHVYLSMFGRFCQYLNENHLTIIKVEKRHIEEFLDIANPNLPKNHPHRLNASRQRKQYRRLIKHVYTHLDLILGGVNNPGREAVMAEAKSKNIGADKATRFLKPEESQAVIRVLQSRLDELRKDQSGVNAWMEYRDLALVGVILGGGLKVSHIGSLTLNCIDRTEERIDLSKPGHAHRARLLSFTVPLLDAWLSVQALMHEDGLQPAQKVFEASRVNGRGRHCKKVTLSASSVHRRVALILDQAGITGLRACPQTLRNTYAALLIDGGASDENLIDFLGLKASITAARLRSSYAQSRAALTSIEALEEEIAAAQSSPAHVST